MAADEPPEKRHLPARRTDQPGRLQRIERRAVAGVPASAGEVWTAAVGSFVVGLASIPVWYPLTIALLVFAVILARIAAMKDREATAALQAAPTLADVLAEEVETGEALLAEADPERLTTGSLIDDFFERGEAWVKRVRAALYEHRAQRLLERWNEPVALWYAGRPMLGSEYEFQQCVIRPLREMLKLLRDIQREAARGDLSYRLDLLRELYRRGQRLRQEIVWPEEGAPRNREESAEAQRRATLKVADWACDVWEVLLEHFPGQERAICRSDDAALGRSGVWMYVEQELHSQLPDTYIASTLAFLSELIDREEARQ